MENTTPKIITTKTLAKVYNIVLDVYADPESGIKTPNIDTVMFKDSFTNEEIENKLIPEMYEAIGGVESFNYMGLEDVNELCFEVIEFENRYESRDWYELRLRTESSPY